MFSRTSSIAVVGCLTVMARIAHADGYRIEFEPEPKFQTDRATGEWQSEVHFGLTGSSWGPLQGLRSAIGEVKRLAGVSDPNESCLYNYYPSIVLPKISDILTQSLFLSWVFVEADTEPEMYAPLDEPIVVEEGFVRTLDGFEAPISITPITNLSQLPDQIDIGYGPISYEWNLAAHFSAAQLNSDFQGRYFWLTAEVPLNRMIPEPSTFLIAAGLAMALRRR